MQIQLVTYSLGYPVVVGLQRNMPTKSRRRGSATKRSAIDDKALWPVMHFTVKSTIAHPIQCNVM